MDIRSTLRNRKSAIAALVLVTIVVAIIVVLILKVPSDDPFEPTDECLLLKDKPVHEHWTNVTSKELNVLATFAGYLTLWTTHYVTVYLPLELAEVSLNYKTTTSMTMHMRTNCANLTIPFRASEHSSWTADKVVMTPINSLMGDLPPTELGVCTFDLYHAEIDQSEGYGCFKTGHKYCYKNEHDKLDLTVNVVAFEINGDRHSYQRGEYTKPSRDCVF